MNLEDWTTKEEQEQDTNDDNTILTNSQLHYLCQTMSGLGAPDHHDDTGWCKDTWTEGNQLANKNVDDWTRDDARLASFMLYKFADTQLPAIGSRNGFVVNSKVMWATRQHNKLEILRYEDNYGPRIALLGWFNADANAELKDKLPFPKAYFTPKDRIAGGQDMKQSGAWTIQDDPEIISTAVLILKGHDVDFTHHLTTDIPEVKEAMEEVVVEQPKPKVDPRYKATLNIDAVELKWPFLNNNAEIRAAIKQVDGWQWDAEKKVWRVPLIQAGKVADLVRPHSKPLSDAILALPEVSTALDASLERVALSQATTAPEDMVEDIKARLKGRFPDGLELYPFQYVGVAFVEAANGRAMIGDEMGIGKTIQAIAYSVLHHEQWPVLVVCPANVKYNWAKEITKWVPDASVCTVKNGKSPIETADYTIINYDLMSKRQDELLLEEYNLVILDESHYIKNRDAQRTKATVAIAKQSKGLICLTGTAITNRPEEWFSNLNLLRPTQFGSYWAYAKRYCAAHQTKFGWDTKGASNLAELNQYARDFMVRRLLSEVIPEMPPLVETFIDVELTADQRKQYRDTLRMWQSDYEYYLDHPPMPKGFVLNMLTELRHLCGQLKAAAAAEYIGRYVDTTDKPIVVFTHHVDVMDAIAEQLNATRQYVRNGTMNWGIIRGGVSAEKRGILVDQFQNGEIDVLLCATVAAKEGITLTNADTVLFVEREWVPAWESQAAARIRRIGQESSHCHQVFLSVSESIDQHFDAVIRAKAAVVSATLNGDEDDRAQGTIVNELLDRIIAENNWRKKE